MKFHYPLFLASVLSATQTAQASLVDEWKITESTFNFDKVENSLIFKYDVDNSILDGNVRMPTLWSNECQSGNKSKGVEEGLTLTKELEDNSSTSGTGKTSVVTINLDPKKIASDNDMYTIDETNNKGLMKFCLRYMLQTETHEVNFIETLVTITVNLSSDFELEDVSVKPKERETATEDKSYDVEAYLCDPDNSLAPYSVALTPTFKQGSLITVCVKPSTASSNDGVLMKSIDSFTWERDETISQSAIVDGVADNTNQLTSLTCDPMSSLCQFSSVLFAGFYAIEGTVTGKGAASVQFNVDEGSTTTSVCDDTRCDEEGARGIPLPADIHFGSAITAFFNDAASPYGSVLNCWDTSAVTSMLMGFSNTDFNDRLDCLDVSNVLDMSGMFGDSFFDSPIGNWNVAKVVNFYGMFYGATAFNQDLCAWKDKYESLPSEKKLDMFNGVGCVDNKCGITEDCTERRLTANNDSAFKPTSKNKNNLPHRSIVPGRALQETAAIAAAADAAAATSEFDISFGVSKLDDGPGATIQTAGGITAFGTTTTTATVMVSVVVYFVGAALLFA